MMRKLKNRRGATMVEMLVAIVVLALLTCAGIAAAAAAMANFLHMNDAANADILASTVLETVAAEVRQGQNIALTEALTDPTATEGNSLTLDSVRWGTGIELKLGTDTGNAGRLVAVVPDAAGATEEREVLPEKAYAGLRLKDLTWTKVGEGGANSDAGITNAGREVYTVTFTVCNDRDNELWHSTVTVAPMRW